MVELSDFVGRSMTSQDELTLGHCQRIAALLDRDATLLAVGDDAPIGWSTTLFGPTVPMSGLANDGHPARGEFLPPVPLPRRMMAGRKLTFHAPIRIGDRIVRRSTIDAVEQKQGRSGRLLFVTVRDELQSDVGPCVTELQSIVYREQEMQQDTRSERVPVRSVDVSIPAWQEMRIPDEAMLFRCSAISFNAHRIHYDRDYCQKVENYPDLVVNASLTTLLLLDLAERNIGFKPASFEARAMAPLFVNRPIRLCGMPTETGAQLWAETDGNVRAMTIDIRR